jgi:hypothetical protein
LTVERFNQFASIALKPDSFYWIDVSFAAQLQGELLPPLLGWGITSDNSGVGVAEGYNSSDATDFMFYPNNNITLQGGPAFQMEVSGPESSTWVLMLAGFGGLAFIGYRRRAALALKGA